jgi:hypothetical protein
MAEMHLALSRLGDALVRMVFALRSVIRNAEAENMPYRGKRKKFLTKNPESGSGEIRVPE